MRTSPVFLLFAAAFALTTTAAKLPTRPAPDHSETDLYRLFENPDNRHRPYVRWWWNGSRVEKDEILRELDVMKAAGIAGVEINTISWPGEADSLGIPALPWLSDRWAEMFNIAAEGCAELGMVCDMIVGSGWPFGAEYLPRDMQLQMLTIQTFDIDGGADGKSFSISEEEILRTTTPHIMSPNPNPLKELKYLRLLPRKVDNFTAGAYYDHLVGNPTIAIDVPPGEYVLYCIVKITGFMNVIEGATGGRGPVLDHFNRKAVDSFLDRFSDKMHFAYPPLKGKLRAAFTDSFELEGGNWSDDMFRQFEKRFGYSLMPYLPYVLFKVGHMGNPINEKYGSEFSEEVREEVVNRVRNDFEHLQIEVFHDNYIVPFNQWCRRNGLKSRVQAYGRALHPLESSMHIDIPECETWLMGNIGVEYHPRDYWNGRSHSMINKFVSSGSFLSGNNLVSCEEITNTGNVFHTTLEEIKIAGDLSNLSGVNQSILHGFNYSPNLKAPFPGWIKYGTYFSENNTWWPYFKLWADYKARLSAVMQNSELQADIAVLHPLEDMWSKWGQQRDPFPDLHYPHYANMLWEAIHQNGNGCDYVSENVIRQSKIRDGKMTFGPRSYNTIILMEVESMNPETADMLHKFAAAGGRIVCIGKVPYQSIGLRNADAKDARVRAAIERIRSSYPDRFMVVESPGDDYAAWYKEVQRKCGIAPYVWIDKPGKFLSQNYYKQGDRHIFFMVNHNIGQSADIRAEFRDDLRGRQPWIWDPETGKRYMLDWDGAAIDLHFGPAETKLIVFDDDRSGERLAAYPAADSTIVVSEPWNVTATHFDKTVRSFKMEELADFNEMPFTWLKGFAGTFEYTVTVRIDSPDDYHTLNAGLTHNGVTELTVNGQPAGVRWWGERKFDVSGMLHPGDNVITVKVTTLLGNYINTLKDNPTARRYHWHANRSLGLAGPVSLY